MTTAWEGLLETNTLAYFSSALLTKKKSFMTLIEGGAETK